MNFSRALSEHTLWSNGIKTFNDALLKWTALDDEFKSEKAVNAERIELRTLWPGAMMVVIWSEIIFFCCFK